MNDKEYARRVAILNDEFRKQGHGIMLTRGIQALGNVAGLLTEVKDFNTFTEDNDPYGEHDFGSIVWESAKVFWKIDYYEKELKGGEDPLSEDCHRVLTVMLSEEY